MDLKSLLLDEISLGTNRSGNKTESSSNTSLHSSFSMLCRTSSKRVLPATPRGDNSKQGIHQTPLVSENRVFKHINQSPMTSNMQRLIQDQKHFTLDHNDEVSAFERTDSRNYRALDEDVGRSRLAMLEEEAGRDPSRASNSSCAVFRRKPNTLRNQSFRHSFMWSSRIFKQFIQSHLFVTSGFYSQHWIFLLFLNFILFAHTLHLYLRNLTMIIYFSSHIIAT